MLEIGGVALLPDWPVFASFVLAGLALNIVPGADMAFIMTAAARRRRDGMVAALGIGGGALVHIFAAVVGLSAILASSQTAFAVLKYAGAAYLAYVALSLLRSPAGEADGKAPSRGQSGWRLFRSAALVNILNPKVALFFLAFLPQFVDPDAAVPAVQILCLGLWFNFAGTIVNLIVAAATAHAAARVAKIGWASKAARWVAATILGGMAVKLALSESRQA